MVKSESSRPIIAAASALALFVAVAAGATQNSLAQYTGGDQAGGMVSAETLQKCQELGISKETCNEYNVLLAERSKIAGGGSGTSFIAGGMGETWALIVVLGAIFGGVAAAFFVKGRVATAP